MHDIDLRRIDLNLLVVLDVLMAERSVSRAAARLARSQSAISHALGRLRDQVGDPLLVKVGGEMRPSPFAEHLAQELRPILSNIRRALVPPLAFDPATTVRESVSRFRTSRLRFSPCSKSASGAKRRRRVLNGWRATPGRCSRSRRGRSMSRSFLSRMRCPKASASPPFGPSAGRRSCARATRRSGPGGAAHGRGGRTLRVRVGVGGPSPVEQAAAGLDSRRTVTTWVPHFSAVAPLLARSALIATLPMVVMHESLERFGLRALRTPFPIAPMTHTLIWSQRLGNDPGLRWLRGHVEAVLNEAIEAADAAMPG